WQFQFLTQDVGELVERDVHLNGMPSLPLTRLTWTRARLALALGQCVSRLPITLADAPGLLAPKSEPRNIDAGNRDRHDLVALAPQHLPLGDILLEILANAPSDDLSKTRVVPVDFQG